MVEVFVVVPVVKAVPLGHLLDNVGDCPLFRLGYVGEGVRNLLRMAQTVVPARCQLTIYQIIAS